MTTHAASSTGTPFPSHPYRLLDLELDNSVGAAQQRIMSDCELGVNEFQRAHVLLRFHGEPMGIVELHVPAKGLSVPDIVSELRQAYSTEIGVHLARDGMIRDTASNQRADPIGEGDKPCRIELDRFLSIAEPITVVVPTRDRPDMLKLCLESLLSSNFPSFEIVIVDNRPRTSMTRELVAGSFGGYSNIRYLVEDRPGSQWARNSGLRLVKTRLVAFTDDDAVVDPDWLGEIARTFHEDDDIACVTGLTLPAELRTQAQVLFEQFSGFNKGRAFARVDYDLDKYRSNDPLFPYLPGAFGAGVNMAFRTEVLKGIGGFDPAFVNGQDGEAFFRVLAHGYRLVFQPKAIARHHHRRDYQALRNQIHRYGIAYTAFLSKCIADRPSRLLDLLRRVPHAVRYLVSPVSARNARKRSDFPFDLVWAELSGMFVGPFAYLTRLNSARRVIDKYGPLDFGELSEVSGVIDPAQSPVYRAQIKS